MVFTFSHRDSEIVFSTKSRCLYVYTTPGGSLLFDFRPKICDLTALGFSVMTL